MSQNMAASWLKTWMGLSAERSPPTIIQSPPELGKITDPAPALIKFPGPPLWTSRSPRTTIFPSTSAPWAPTKSPPTKTATPSSRPTGG